MQLFGATIHARLTEDGEGGGVDEAGPRPEHQAVAEVEQADLRVVAGRQRQPQRGQHRPRHSRGAEADLGAVSGHLVWRLLC